MKKRRALILLAGVALMSCTTNNPDAPDGPKQDTIIVVDTVIVSDTLVVDTIRVDTLRCDTVIRDTLVELMNDQIVLSYCGGYYSTRPDPKYTTHTCYSFAMLVIRDSVYQKFEVLNYDSNFKRLVKLKDSYPNLKILLSFGNTGGSLNEFSIMCADSAQRKHFAADCLKFCQDNNIDGIDLDWEFPGKGKGSDPVHDVDNYTALFRDLRAALGSDRLLTFAAAPTDKKKIVDEVSFKTTGYQLVDLKAVEPYIDFANLMCYDYDQGDVRHAPHNAWKGGPTDNGYNVYWSIMQSYNAYKQSGFPMNKLVIGVAFYGRHNFVSVAEGGEGEIFYRDIESRLKLKQFTRKYNSTWQVPVLYKNNQFWCSYDDTVSIAFKGGWLKDRGMRGIMHWQVNGDNGKKDLQRTCWQTQKCETHRDTSYQYTVDSILVRDTIYISDTILHRDTTYVKRNMNRKD